MTNTHKKQTPTLVSDTLTSPKTDTVSISSASMLVELNISVWTGRKLDRKASADVTTDNQAVSGVANVHKNLMAGSSLLKEIASIAGEARNGVHYHKTMPWSNTGIRLLPTALYMGYHAGMTDLQDRFKDAVCEFITNYNASITRAEHALGDMFDISDYPDALDLASKFRFSFTYTPLPDAGDFRLDIQNDAIDQIKTDYAEHYEKQIGTAMKDIWRKAYDALTKMSERIDYAGHEVKKVFRDSLVDNVTDMVEILELSNVTGDSQMSALALTLDDALRGVTADALRQDPNLRKEVKKSVDSVIASLPSLEM